MHVYDDDFPSCEETRATLLVYPGSIDPQEVSDRLGLEPTSSGRRGDVVISSAGRTRQAAHNTWFLSSEGVVQSKDLRRHIDWLTAQLLPKREPLLSLQAEADLGMYVSCVWWSKEGHGGPTLSPRQLADLSQLNLECGFDVYFFGPTL
jgi:hypothetical protein